MTPPDFSFLGHYGPPAVSPIYARSVEDAASRVNFDLVVGGALDAAFGATNIGGYSFTFPGPITHLSNRLRGRMLTSGDPSLAGLIPGGGYLGYQSPIERQVQPFWNGGQPGVDPGGYATGQSTFQRWYLDAVSEYRAQDLTNPLTVTLGPSVYPSSGFRTATQGAFDYEAARALDRANLVTGGNLPVIVPPYLQPFPI